MLGILKKIGGFFTEIVNGITNKKWKLYIYYKSQCVKVLKVDGEERPIRKAYVVDVWFKKHIFCTNHAKVVLVPMRILFFDKDKKVTHVESILYEGVDVE